MGLLRVGVKVGAGFRNDLENPIQNVISILERVFSETVLLDQCFGQNGGHIYL